MFRKKGWLTNLFLFYSYIRDMDNYYLGLLLKYQAKEKYHKPKLSFELGFQGVWFPKIRRVFPKLMVDELVSPNDLKFR